MAFYSTEEEAGSRLVVYGGVSRRPEQLKAAMHYIRLGHQYILEGKREEALDSLSRAESRLQMFLIR